MGEIATSQSVHSLPEHIVTGSGISIYPNQNLWVIPSTSSVRYLNFNSIESQLDSMVLFSLKRSLLYYLERTSDHHAANMFNLFVHFIRTTDDGSRLQEITVQRLISYRSQLSKRNAFFLSSLKGFLLTWYDLGYRGIGREVPSFLKSLRLRGNQKGDAVRTMDPEKGPFTDEEVQSLYNASSRAFSNGGITLQQYLLLLLFLALGARPSQYASVKLSDFEVSRAADGTANFVLQVPRAKQREEFYRAQFRPRRLDPDIGKLLEALAQSVRLEAESLADKGVIARVHVSGMLPLFPQWNSNMPLGFEHHANGDRLARELKKIGKVLELNSPRTGERLKLSPTRFRRTLGTRAAQEGQGPLVIAGLLDHEDTQNVGVYVEATPRIAERINKAVALELAPLAQAFCGLLVDREQQADRGDDPSSRLRSNVNPTSFVGSCGKHGFCGGLAPISCYTCQLFQPWLNGPHEEVLDALVAERDHILEETGDERMAAVNDATIYAAAQVVELCRARKAESDQ